MTDGEYLQKVKYPDPVDQLKDELYWIDNEIRISIHSLGSADSFQYQSVIFNELKSKQDQRDQIIKQLKELGFCIYPKL